MKTPKTFVASDFTSTLKFDTAEDKAKFANQFVKFVKGGYMWKDFPDWFYKRLSMTFGHIAHYDRGGFFDTFFEDERGERDFIYQTMNYPCWGQPEFTYCDVEKKLQEWMESYRLKGGA